MATRITTEKSPLISPSPASRWGYIPARYVLTFWIFGGFVLMNCFRFQLNVTILAMTTNVTSGTILAMNNNLTTSGILTNQTSVELSNVDEASSNRTGFNTTYEMNLMTLILENQTTNINVTLENQTYKYPANLRFDWSSDEVNLILGSFFWGYISTLILGGWLVSKCGGKMIFGICNMTCSLLSVLLPVISELGPTAVIIDRVLMGAFQAMLRTCEYELWKAWAPRCEIEVLRGLSLSGLPVGAILSTVLNAYICHEFGWTMVFYFYGVVGIVWSLFWIIFIYESPYQHPRISVEEREYISNNLSSATKTKEKIDWIKVVKSPAFWAPTAANFSYRWIGIGMSLVLPEYLTDILGLEIVETGFLLSLGLGWSLLTLPLSASISALLIFRKILSIKNTRKVTTLVGLFIPCVMTTLMCFTQSKMLTLICITVSFAMAEFAMMGFSNNYIDIAPKFSGMLFAVGNTIAASTGFLSPAILELISFEANGENSFETWVYFFVTSLSVMFLGGLFFLLFAKEGPQQFSKDSRK